MSSTLRVKVINISTTALIGFCFPLFLAWTILGAYWYRALTEGPMLCVGDLILSSLNLKMHGSLCSGLLSALPGFYAT